jgi:uncharacterized membrane protein YkoI
MHRTSLALAAALSLSLAAAAAGTAAAQTTTYKRDVPPALAKQAKVTEAAAAATARKLMPHAAIAALELEHENGHLLYSFDMKTAGKDGIDEVNVDAMTGKQVGTIDHESSAAERKEAAAEARAKGKRKGGGN